SSLSSTLKVPKTAGVFARSKRSPCRQAAPKGDGKLKTRKRFLQGGLRKKMPESATAGERSPKFREFRERPPPTRRRRSAPESIPATRRPPAGSFPPRESPSPRAFRGNRRRRTARKPRGVL